MFPIGVTLPHTTLSVGGQISSDNSGENFFLFNNTWDGGLDSSLDYNGIRWQTPEQGSGLASLRFYMLYNYALDKL